MLVQLSLQTLEPFSLCIERANGFLEDKLWRRGGTDHFREPPQMGRAPGGPAGVADVVSEQTGFEPQLGSLEIADGVFTRAGEVTDRLIFPLRDLDGGEVPRAHQAGQLDRVTAIGVHAVAGLFGNEGGGHHPAVVAFFPQITLEPGAPGPRLRDQDQVCGRGLQVSDERVNVTLAGADGAAVDALGVVAFSHRSDGNGRFMPIQSDIARARLGQG